MTMDHVSYTSCVCLRYLIVIEGEMESDYDVLVEGVSNQCFFSRRALL
jgi:hypothetical protein